MFEYSVYSNGNIIQCLPFLHSIMLNSIHTSFFILLTLFIQHFSICRITYCHHYRFECMSASLCHYSLMKVAASYWNVGKQSSILASVNESLVMSVLSHSGLFKTLYQLYGIYFGVWQFPCHARACQIMCTLQDIVSWQDFCSCYSQNGWLFSNVLVACSYLFQGMMTKRSTHAFKMVLKMPLRLFKTLYQLYTRTTQQFTTGWCKNCCVNKYWTCSTCES